MSIQNQLQKTNFRGVDFFWQSIMTSGGRKLAIHEFPNKDIRYIDDLGKLSKSFNIEATVSQNNYKQNINNLIDALEEQGSSILIHPILGSLEVQVQDYSLNENINELGSAKFTINFLITASNIFPTKTTDNKPAILTKSISLLTNIKDYIAANFIAPISSFASFTDAKNKVLNFVDQAKSVADDLQQNVDKINEYAEEINNITENINTIISLPAELASSINNIIVSGQLLFDTPKDIFSYFQSLFSFGDDDIVLPEITSDRILRQDNRNILNTNIQLASLTEAYQTTINLTFDTTDDIDNIKDILETQYNKLNENELLDFDLKSSLQDLRNDISTYLSAQLEVASNIQTLTVYNEPLSAVVYRLYGSLENMDNISDLNNFDNVSFINGDINILVGTE